MFRSVNLSAGPPQDAWTTYIDYAGGSNPVYSMLARSVQPPFVYTGATVSKAAAASVGYVAHGLQTGQPVTISGATGDWAAMNGTLPVTVTGSDAFTVAINSTGFTGSFNGMITTTAPRTTAACWAISKNYYDGSNSIGLRWANGSVIAVNIALNRATLNYQ